MKSLLLSLSLLIALVAVAPAQGGVSPEQQKRSEEIFNKMRQIDLLMHITPIAMDKKQLNDMLTALEKIRARQKTIYKVEAEQMAKMEKRLDDALAVAYEKGQYPDRQILSDIAKLTRNMSIVRQAAAGEMVDEIVAVAKKTLNEGQLKVMANSLNPTAVDPTLKPEEMKDDDKIKLFVRQIFLDPLAYDIMVRLTKEAKE